MSEVKLCHDCGCKEGELHQPGCDMERCSICGQQLITCGHAGIEYLENQPRDFKHIPYIQYPNICGRCGKLWPEMFTVPDEEWEKYIEPAMRDKILCRDCYSGIKSLIDAGVN